MLQLSGKVLGVQSETRNGPTGPFQSITIHVLSGVEVFKVQTGRDFDPSTLPREGEDVTLEVAVSAFVYKSGGAGVQITGLQRIGARRVAAAG